MVLYKGNLTLVRFESNTTLEKHTESILKERGISDDTISKYLNIFECICEEFYDEFYYHKNTQRLFIIERERFEPILFHRRIEPLPLPESNRFIFELQYDEEEYSFSRQLTYAFNEYLNND